VLPVVSSDESEAGFLAASRHNHLYGDQQVEERLDDRTRGHLSYLSQV